VSKIRTLVVDDEQMARERVLSFLQQEDDVEVVGECSDGAEAVRAIRTHAPDLVFLDVQMPGVDGFGVIEAVGADRMPTVVFVTAYDEYALRAFEVHALDYLLKPFGRDRFRETLKHARSSLDRQRAGDLGRRLLALVGSPSTEGAAPGFGGTGPRPSADRGSQREDLRLDRLVVKSGGRVFFLRTEDIDWIEAAGNYVRLHMGDESHLFRETMNNIEARLDTRRFVRVHRSRIVNTDRIKELQPAPTGEYLVVLHNGARLPLSRGYRDKLQEQLGKRF
jgi:two-component system LytT family response regulator